MLITVPCYAWVTRNIYQVSYDLDAGEDANISFTLPVREITVFNYDSNIPIWVVLDSDTATTATCSMDTEGCFLVASNESVQFSGRHITDKMSIVNDSQHYASWISIIAVY